MENPGIGLDVSTLRPGIQLRKRMAGHERPLRVLDLFCGAGAVAVGYADAGLKVVGVDIRQQDNYPFEFHKADAMEVVVNKGLIEWLDVDIIHASPPCQSYSLRTMHLAYPQPKLIEPLREALLELIGGGLIRGYVIENVEGAPLLKEQTIMLCGTMFGKRIQRHRLFEFGGFSKGEGEGESVVGGFVTGFGCNHGIGGERGLINIFRSSGDGTMREWYSEMFDGRKWMTQKEAMQAVPCCYTEFIGLNLAGQNF